MSGVKTFVFAGILAALLLSAAPSSPQSAAAPQGSSTAQSNSGAQAAAAPQTGSAPAPAAGQTQKPPAGQATPASPTAVRDPPTVAWKMLNDGVASDKYPTRSDAIAALSILGTDRRALRLMIKALDDKETIIRVQAATSLGQIKARAAIPPLRATLEDKEPQVAFAAAQALWEMGDRSGRELIYEVLDGERKTQPGLIKGNIAKAKAEMHDPKALILIGINSTSVALLGPGALGVTAVEEMATNHSAPVQALAAKMLGEDMEAETVDELKSALGDKSGTVRIAAVHALASMNRPEAIPALVDMMQNDKERAARFAAAAAVIHLDQRKVGSGPGAAPQNKPQQTPAQQSQGTRPQPALAQPPAPSAQ